MALNHRKKFVGNFRALTEIVKNSILYEKHVSY